MEKRRWLCVREKGAKMTADRVLVRGGEKGESCKAVWGKAMQVGFVFGNPTKRKKGQQHIHDAR